MKICISVLSSAVLFLAAFLPAASSCNAKSAPDDWDVSRIAWSSYCTGPGPRSIALLRRSAKDGQTGKAAYFNRFRGEFDVTMLGTYESNDPSIFNGALALVKKADLASIRLQTMSILDGCADFVSITACNVTLTVSDANVYDERILEFKKLKELVKALNDVAARATWHKTSDEKSFKPVWALEADWF